MSAAVSPPTNDVSASAGFVVTLTNDRQEHIGEANGYQPEGPLTTFFSNHSTRNVLDSWSTRHASYRTAEIVAIKRIGTAS